MTELFSSLGIEWSVMLAQLVNFAILFAVLGKFVYKPVMKLLRERQESVARVLEREAFSAKKLLETEADRENLLSAARAESQKIIDAAKQDGEAMKKKMLAEAQGEIAQRSIESEKRLVAEKARLVAEARRELGSIVVGAIEQALGDALDARTQGRMVEQALAILRKHNGNPKSETLNSKQFRN